MNEILKMNINEMPLSEFDCSCGKHHKFCVHDIAIGKGAINQLSKIAEPFKDGNILIISDNNTYDIAAKKAKEILENAGFKNVTELIFDMGKKVLIPDEYCLGKIISNIKLDTKLIVACGGGVLNDATKYITSRTKTPYAFITTSPSMDGYVSDGAAIICDGIKVTPKAHFLYALIGDTDILKNAPMRLISGGYGDIVGKITCLADWDLAVKVQGDYFCETSVELVKKALDKCLSTATGLKDRSEESIEALMEALTISGIAMALIKNSRPASGAEHLISHYWEMEYIKQGKNPIAHGMQVAVASSVVARFFEELKDILPEGTYDWCKPHQEIDKYLKLGSCPTSPIDLGIDRELFKQSLLHCYSVRARYSVFKFAKAHNRLEEITDKITKEFYGE